MKEETSLQDGGGRRRHSFMAKIVRSRQMSFSRRLDLDEDVILLHRKDEALEEKDLWDAPLVKPNEQHAQESSRSETESAPMKKNKLSEEAAHSIKSERLPKQSRSQSWKKIGRPLLASWQKLGEQSSSVGGETASSNDDDDSLDECSHSSGDGDAGTEPTQDETFDWTVDEPSEFVRDDNNEEAKPADKTPLPAVNEQPPYGTCQADQHQHDSVSVQAPVQQGSDDEQVDSSRTTERVKLSEPHEDGNEDGAIYSRSLDEFEQEAEPVPDESNGQVSQGEWTSVVSSFLGSLSMSFDALSSEKTPGVGSESGEKASRPKDRALAAFDDSFAVPIDAFQNPPNITVVQDSGREPSIPVVSETNGSSTSPQKRSPSVNIVLKKFAKPMSTVLSGADLMMINRSDSKDTANSSHDSIWDDVDVNPIEQEEWISFGDTPQHGNVGFNGLRDVTADNQNDFTGSHIGPGYPDDEESIGVPEAAWRHSVRNQRVPKPSSEAKPLEQCTRKAPRRRITARSAAPCALSRGKETARTMETSYHVKGATEDQSDEVRSRIKLKLEKLGDDCSGLLCTCLEVTIDACQALVLLGDCVLVGAANTCCIDDKTDKVSSKKAVRARRSKRYRDRRAPITMVEVDKDATLSKAESEDYSSHHDSIEARTNRPSPRAKREPVVIPNPVNRAHVGPSVPGYNVPPYFFDEEGIGGWPTSAPEEPKTVTDDETLVEDVDRFMIAMQPIKECQQQVRELRGDHMRSKGTIEREEQFWRQHEAKWKARLPFRSNT